MQLFSYRHTMSNAHPIAIEPAIVDHHRLSERDRARQEQAAKLAAERKMANDAIRAANLALRHLHNQWALEAAQEEEEQVMQGSTVLVSDITRRICRATGVSVVEIMGEGRSRNVVFARQAIMYWAVRRTNRSLPQIGRLMGGKDHTTVLHSRDTYPKKRAKMGRYLRSVR